MPQKFVSVKTTTRDLVHHYLSCP